MAWAGLSDAGVQIADRMERRALDRAQEIWHDRMQGHRWSDDPRALAEKPALHFFERPAHDGTLGGVVDIDGVGYAAGLGGRSMSRRRPA
jgi:hypothetical protein